MKQTNTTFSQLSPENSCRNQQGKKFLFGDISNDQYEYIASALGQ